MKSLSKINSKLSTHYLFFSSESQYLERKGLGVKELKPLKIAEELIGMLNADGGVLVLGVSDDGKIEGLNTIDEKRLNQYRTVCFDFISPTPNVILEEVLVEGNLLFFYHVELDFERLFRVKDNENVFLRVLDSNRKLSLDQIKKLEYDKAIRKFEDENVREFEMTDLDSDLLETYKQKINFKGDVNNLLLKRYLAQNKNNAVLIKHSGVLLFAKNPEKYIPSASVRYIRYSGKEALVGLEHNVVKDERFEGNLPNLIDRLKVFLNASFRDYYFFDLADGKFKKVAEYPEEAWLEGIVNALCHRSYNNQGSSVYIKHFDDKLEITNSGPLPAQVTIENIKSERYSRNPRVARVLEDLGYVRQLNEGVSRIYKSMEKSMLSTPEYRESNGNVYLTLRNKIREHSKTIHDKVIRKIEDTFETLNETQITILSHLYENQSSTILDFSKATNVNEKTVKLYLNKFVEDSILERISKKIRDKNARYIFKKH